VKKSTKTQENKVLNEIDRKLRRIQVILTVIIGALLLVLIGVLFILNNGTQKKTQIVKPTIALVNEDREGRFNGTIYNFGQSFVNLVSNDDKYNWQVVSRSVADRAYSDGSVQAVIYLPQDFTQNILTLQAIDPQQAQVDYKVLNAQSEVNNKLLQNKIVHVLYDFNTSVVKMYYASVAGNVANAQTNMNNVVNSQDSILTNLKSNVYGPFQTTHQSYGSVITVADGLKYQNDSWIQAQNSFTTSIVTMLKGNSETFNGTLPNLTNYFDTQKRITETNLKNANQGITNQAALDNDYYYGQYTATYNQSLGALHQFVNQDETGKEVGLYADLKARLTSYNEKMSGVRDDIDSQIGQLIEKKDMLLGLEKELYTQFFAQDVLPTAEQTDFTTLETDDNARSAMAALLSQSFGERENLKDTAYPDTISQLLSQLSIDTSEYEPLLNALETNGSITLNQRKAIIAELGVLSNYAADFNLTTANVDFMDVPASNTTDQTFNKQLTVVVPAAKRYTLSLQAKDGIDNNNISLVSATDDNGTELNITKPTSITLDNRTKPGTDANGNPTTTPATSPMIYHITYQVSLGQAENAKVTVKWGERSGTQAQSVDTFGLIPANTISEYAGGNQFGYITTLLNNIHTASRLIAVLYGAPGATPADMKDVTDFALSANPKSIYRMYGNMDQSEIGKRLSDDDVAQYKQSGTENIRKVRETLSTLNSTIASLQVDEMTLTNHLPEDHFAQISSELNTWYTQTIAALNDQYQAWTTNQTNLLQQEPWTSYNQSDFALYYDKAMGETLYGTISGLVSSTAKQATDTANSSQIIKSNAETFSLMVNAVTKTQNEAKEVMANTGNLLTSGNDELKVSQNYSNNFSSVLSNTRTAGVDSNKLFGFFAQPLSAKDMTPKEQTIVSNFDWRWLIVLVIGILLGTFFTLMIKLFLSRRARQN
jgi:type VII secretion EsaA-like protein